MGLQTRRDKQLTQQKCPNVGHEKDNQLAHVRHGQDEAVDVDGQAHNIRLDRVKGVGRKRRRNDEPVRIVRQMSDHGSSIRVGRGLHILTCDACDAPSETAQDGETPCVANTCTYR